MLGGLSRNLPKSRTIEITKMSKVSLGRRLPPRFVRICTTILCLLAFLLLTRGEDFGAAAATFQTRAPFVILLDYDTGAVLFEKNADVLMDPASTTKILTAEIVFREIANGRLRLGDKMTISARAASEGDAQSGGSSMFAQVNSQVSVEDLLRGLLITSGNDAAIALAEGVAGSEAAFAVLMNKRAHELGMKRSSFANAWGEGAARQKVTARDMARLAAYVIRTYPQFYRFFGEREFSWNDIQQQNRNPLLSMNLGADGLKTGHLGRSGYGLVGSAIKNGRRLILC